jgi:DNA polymerase bacteriophage-type
MAWAIDDEEPRLWHPGCDTGAVPWETFGEVRAWNAQFERIIWDEIMVRRHGFPPLTLETWVDTAAEAAALALPRGLEMAAQVLGLDVEKDMAGRRLMLQMSKPRKVGGWFEEYECGCISDPVRTKKECVGYCPKHGNDTRRVHPAPEAIFWWDQYEKLERLYEYCKQDVRVERAVKQRLRPLSDLEREVYLMDQRMNDRGIYVDLPLVHAAQSMVDRVMEEANEEIAEVTDGQVTSVTKVADLTAFTGLDNLRKDTVRDVLADDLADLDAAVQRALELRQEAGKSSTSKLVAFINSADIDSRLRGLLLYHAASTGRWGGKRVQPQNFPRPEIRDVEAFIELVMENQYELIDMQYPVAQVISSMLRSMIRAAPGKVLRAGDYAQIEARVLAWLAEQDDLVELFARGGKVYEDMAAFIFEKPIEEITKDSFERQIGKNSILGAGFGMGADRFAEQVQEQTGIVLDRGEYLITCRRCGLAARRAGGEPWGKCCSRPDTERVEVREDIAAKAINGYRTKNEKITQFRRDIEDAAKRAIADPGSVHSMGLRNMIRFTVRGQFLWCRLPSGRLLAYAKPSLRRRRVEKDDGTSFTTTSIAYMGVNSMTRKWQRQYSYGGHLTENVVQAVARDLMATAMLRLERAGYLPVLTVHDEVVTEGEEDEGSLDEFLHLMQTKPAWADGLPVEVEGWEGERYRK